MLKPSEETTPLLFTHVICRQKNRAELKQITDSLNWFLFQSDAKTWLRMIPRKKSYNNMDEEDKWGKDSTLMFLYTTLKYVHLLLISN